MESENPSAATEGNERVGTVQLDLGAEEAGSCIRLPARQLGVAVVRQFVTGMGNMLHLDEHACEDLKLAATEACTNAVVHAYPNGNTGPMEVEVDTAAGEELVVVVRDHGRGPPPEDVLDNEHEGYGLSLIEAVSDEVRLDPAEGGGTEVRMRFHHARETPDEPLDAVHSPVLRRVIALMAAHAGFSMDRLSDAVLVAETLAAHTPSHATDGIVRVAIEDQGGAVLMRVGPLEDGGAAALLESSRLPAYGPVLEHLADGVEADTSQADQGEYLVVRLARR